MVRFIGQFSSNDSYAEGPSRQVDQLAVAPLLPTPEAKEFASSESL
jgi:hypothetical protein